MSFDTPYQFKAKNTVVIQQPGANGKYIRVNPNNMEAADATGGTGEYGQWEAIPSDGGSKVRFKSLKTGKYLRIMNDQIGANGGAGKYTLFKVHRDGEVTRLESDAHPGKYVAVNKEGTVMRIGGGGPWTRMKIKRRGPFTQFYKFKMNNTVVIQQPGANKKFIRVNPNNMDAADAAGGKGEYGRWEAIPSDGGSKCRFKSIKTGKYLRIMNDQLNANGGTGKFTLFRIHRDGNETRLESDAHPGKFIAVNQAGDKMRIGSGGKWTRMKIYRK